MKKNSQIDRVRQFFQEKFLFQTKLQALEKSIFDFESELQGLEEHLRQLKSIAKAQDSTYFVHRLQRLETLFSKFRTNKGYNSKEFEQIYTLLGKLKEDDSSHFLGELVNQKLKEVAQSLEPKAKSYNHREQGNIPFSWKGTWYLLPDYDYKIINDIPHTKEKIRYKNNLYSIYPESEPTKSQLKTSTLTKQLNAIVLLGEIPDDLYRCYYYDEIEERINIEADVLEEALKETRKFTNPIRGTFRYKGKKYHVIGASDLTV